MNVDVRSLATFNRLAREGAEFAAASLGRITALEPSVETSRITFVARSEVGEEFADREVVGVEVDFVGGMAGTTVLVLERSVARELVDAMPSPGTGRDAVESKVTELGNILLSRFVDGWADYLGTTIEITPPSYTEGVGVDVLPAPTGPSSGEEQVVAFSSRLRTASTSATAYIYMFPEFDSVQALADAGESGEAAPVPLDELAVFNRMTTTGAETASRNITSMTGIETSVDVARLSFVPIEDAPKQVSCGECVGTVVEFEGVPSGHLVVLFDEPSARSVVGELRRDPADDVPFDGMSQSAIKEIGNVMTSGFVDGWANVLETTIDISPPTYVHDMGRAILDPIAVRLGRSQDFAFMIDSTIETPDREIECDVFALPDGDELRRALASLPDQPEGEAAPFARMKANHDDP